MLGVVNLIKMKLGHVILMFLVCFSFFTHTGIRVPWEGERMGNSSSQQPY